MRNAERRDRNPRRPATIGNRELCRIYGKLVCALALFGWPLVAAVLYKSLPFSRPLSDYPGRLPDLPSDVTIKFAMIPALR